MDKDNNEWLDYEKLSDYLKLSVRTLYNMKSQNRLPFTRIGGHILFNKQEINALLEENHIDAIEY